MEECAEDFDDLRVVVIMRRGRCGRRGRPLRRRARYTINGNNVEIEKKFGRENRRKCKNGVTLTCTVSVCYDPVVRRRCRPRSRRNGPRRFVRTNT